MTNFIKININTEIYNIIEEYCKLNGYENIEEQINSWLMQGFNIERYGDTPFTNYGKSKTVEQEQPIEGKKEVVSETVENIEPKEEIEQKPRVTKRKVRIIKN